MSKTVSLSLCNLYNISTGLYRSTFIWGHFVLVVFHIQHIPIDQKLVQRSAHTADVIKVMQNKLLLLC